MLFNKYTNSFLITGLILSILPFGSSGSYYDVFIIPAACVLFLINIFGPSHKSIGLDFYALILSLFAFIIPLISFATSADISAICIYGLRIFGLLSMICFLYSFNGYAISFRSFASKASIWIFPMFILLINLLSVLKFTTSSYSLGLDYPFYTVNSINRQTFGPSMTLTSVYMLFAVYYLFPRNRFRLALREIFASLLVLFVAIFSLAIGVFSGSRGWFLVFISLFLTIISYAIVFVASNHYKIPLSRQLISLLKNKFFVITMLLVAVAVVVLQPISLIDLSASSNLYRGVSNIAVNLLDPSRDQSRGSIIGINILILDYLFSFDFTSAFQIIARNENTFLLDNILLSFLSVYGLLFSLAFLMFFVHLCSKDIMLSLFSCYVIINFFVGGTTFLAPRFYLFPFAALFYAKTIKNQFFSAL